MTRFKITIRYAGQKLWLQYNLNRYKTGRTKQINRKLPFDLVQRNNGVKNNNSNELLQKMTELRSIIPAKIAVESLTSLKPVSNIKCTVSCTHHISIIQKTEN